VLFYVVKVYTATCSTWFNAAVFISEVTYLDKLIETFLAKLLDRVSVPYSRLGSRTGNPIFCDRPCITKIFSKVRVWVMVTKRASSLPRLMELISESQNSVLEIQ
jgi:hypothetical protein